MITKEFAIGGQARFTVQPPQSFAEAGSLPSHYTYLVRRFDGRHGWKGYSVLLLTGPDNTQDYSYLGMLDPNLGGVRLTGKSKLAEDSWPVKILRRVMARLWAGEGQAIETAGWKVHHEGRCARCGRTLTVPESVESGFGPECIKKVCA